MSNHINLNPARFIVTQAEADKAIKTQRGLCKLAEDIRLKRAEIPVTRVKKSEHIDIGFFNIVDQKTYENTLGVM